MEIFVFALVPIASAWLWIRTACRLWRDGKAWKKATAVIVSALCVVGLVASCVSFYQMMFSVPSECTLSLPFVYYVFVLLMLVLNGILMKRRWKYWILTILAAIVGLFVALVFTSFVALYSDCSISKQDASFKDKEDIEERLRLKNFPSCSYVEAYHSERDDGNIRVNFKYDGVDSATVFRYIERLKRQHPMQCEAEESGEVYLKYRTLCIDHEAKDTTYVNIVFLRNYQDGFVVGYGIVSAPDDLRSIVKCSLPKSKLISYEIHRFGPDYGWDGTYSFERPLTKADIRRLRQACKDMGWEFSEEEGRIAMHYFVECKYSYDITLVKYTDGNIRFAELEYNTY